MSTTPVNVKEDSLLQSYLLCTCNFKLHYHTYLRMLKQLLLELHIFLFTVQPIFLDMDVSTVTAKLPVFWLAHWQHGLSRQKHCLYLKAL